MGIGLVRNIRHRHQGRQNEKRMLKQERELRTDLEQKNLELTSLREEALSAATEAEKANKAKSLFVANMSHEIRRPLNAVLGYAQIMRRDHGLTDAPLQAVNAIEKSGNHLLRLIDDMLELSRIESGRLTLKPAPFHLAEMIRGVSDIVSINCANKKLNWTIRWFEMESSDSFPSTRHYLTDQPHTCLIHEDESKLKQVLLNLLSNAVKFTRNGDVRLEIGLPPHWKTSTPYTE